MWFSIIVISVLLVYIGLIANFILGWNRIKPFKASGTSNAEALLSCIIPFRNEEHHLKQLITNLNRQQNANYEVVLVDDNSTDGSYALVEQLISSLDHFKLLKNNLGEGKKLALKQGVTVANGEYIVFSDADCMHPSSWLSTIGSFLNSKNTDLLIGPVKYHSPSNFFEWFQAVDFLSLITSGAGAAGLNRAIMCNGANLIVKKALWLQAQDSLNESYASGDDIFLLQYCKDQGKQIEFLKSSAAIVQTFCEKTLKGFLRQRVRWASKSKAYTDKFTICVAWIVFISNMVMLTIPLWFFYNISMASVVAVFAMFKILIDYILLKKGAAFVQYRINFFSYISIAIIYPFYIVASVLMAVKGPRIWKGRKI